MTAAISPGVGELANSTLETLQVINRHTASCRQCKTGPDVRWCTTYATYTANFQGAYNRWADAHARARQLIGASADA